MTTYPLSVYVDGVRHIIGEVDISDVFELDTEVDARIKTEKLRYLVPLKPKSQPEEVVIQVLDRG